MTVEALNPGVSKEWVQEQTGFELKYATDLRVNEPPTETELHVLRELDPERLLLGSSPT
jgi:glutaconate CoA-transferase subunit B